MNFRASPPHQFKRPTPVRLFDLSTPQNPRPSLETPRPHRAEFETCTPAQDSHAPKSSAANGLAHRVKTVEASLCSSVASRARCIVEGSASFSPLSQPFLAETEWSFTLPTRRAPIQPARPTACSLQAKMLPVVGAPGNGDLAPFSNASRSTWQPPPGRPNHIPKKGRALRAFFLQRPAEQTHLEERAVTPSTSFLGASFWMLRLPLKYAPSSMEMRWVAMSPMTTADCFRSTRSLA